ncbi:lipid IV(A) 3-deoxy-D-manno-octulosonic acid transferase [Methylophaga sp.]|jgi:3-deoxy-D-manno-octulosonic-acid transferase|uniref:lipid IV(A) 3-deoxy-D-manno-octulosonic acid transferase n=1 Tax=Methylophaga sp. TaxID=2024840 RepID=UPI001400BA44|nr:lipid IV(A) 3-deoxy-D-manno-octulosonic acid transferase [Methylophaga sp.]MTI63334.1 3-deoxy-D-manno-octulosonic acid transferase [Methylophaga sp.]
MLSFLLDFRLANESELRFLYSFVFILAVPLILLRLLWRGSRASAYFKRWDERFGIKPAPSASKPVLWLHAVSVGEVEAARPLVEALQAQYDSHQILITTMTPTGSARVTSLYGDKVLHCYLPYDLPFAVTRFLKSARPELGIIMETELWPNLIHHAHALDIPLVLANARLSARSAAGYQKIGKLTRVMLQQFSLIAAQSQDDRQRFIALGADKESVHAVGNLKFEIALPASLSEEAEALRSIWGNRPVFIAASTHEGEDEIILNASRKIRAAFPDLLLILVPRHPERFDKVAALSQRSGFKILRRSENGMCSRDIQVLVVDTMGELPLFYGTADIAFVGGSLVPRGGHNLLEPAALGRAVIIGPHYFNFSEISRQFLEADAAIQVNGSEMLADRVTDLLRNPQKRADMGQAGQNLIKQSQGASKRLLNLIKRHIDV